ncbi:TIGR01212 family radical SAM protein [Eubacteriaceae bacterium ES3]|nr:TIGR01212 family radical SAM protein [Eubacteriaceae bacterium ES3]
MYSKKPYHIYSKWLKEKYGEKVYKIPINIPVTCPNRDGTKGTGGCIYCGAKGGGNETLSDSLPVTQQLEQNIAYMGKRYHANKFIAYFQSFTNTHCNLTDFKGWIEESIIDSVVEIAISTRPDSIITEQLEFLSDIGKKYNIEITLELGLQTVNEKTLTILNRRHTLNDYIDAVERISSRGLKTCTHLILDLPWDSESDVIKAAGILSELKTDFVKCHSLYIERNTVLNNWYQAGKVKLLSQDEYIHRAILFLEYLDQEIVIQRLIGRAPAADSVITNWNTSWWKIKEELEKEMISENRYQGRLYKKTD